MLHHHLKTRRLVFAAAGMLCLFSKSTFGQSQFEKQFKLQVDSLLMAQPPATNPKKKPVKLYPFKALMPDAPQLPVPRVSLVSSVLRTPAASAPPSTPSPTPPTVPPLFPLTPRTVNFTIIATSNIQVGTMI